MVYPAFPDSPFMASGNVRTPLGLALPPGAEVAAYVSNASYTYPFPYIENNRVSTLAAGLARARSGLGDYVICLPGHSESVTDNTMLDNLVSGTRIVGVGEGGLAPTFRWTATASQWIMNDADVLVEGLRLRLEGANGVVKAIVCTAADCSIRLCDIEVASGASNKSTIAIELGTGGDRFSLVRNILRGTATHNVTDGVKIVAAVTSTRIEDNEMIFSATAANGLIHLTAAALNVKIARNLLYNTHTSSTSCITVDASTAADGVISDNKMATRSTGTATSATEGIAFPSSSTALFRCFENYVANDPRTSGLLLPTVDT